MDFLIEFVAELVFDTAISGAESAAGNRRIPRPVRYVLVAFILLVFVAVFFLIFLVGILLMRDGNYPGGILMLALGALMLFMTIRKYRIMYDKVRKSSDEGENKGEGL